MIFLFCSPLSEIYLQLFVLVFQYSSDTAHLNMNSGFCFRNRKTGNESACHDTFMNICFFLAKDTSHSDFRSFIFALLFSILKSNLPSYASVLNCILPFYFGFTFPFLLFKIKVFVFLILPFDIEFCLSF